MTSYIDGQPLYLSAAGRDTLITCGWVLHMGRDMGFSMTHCNLLTGEPRCTVELDGRPNGMTTVLHDNRTCVAMTYHFR